MNPLCSLFLPLPLLFLALPVSSTLTTECSESQVYRSYDGSCNNNNISGLGIAGQTFVLFSSTAALVKLKPITNLTQGEDPVTEWLKELLDFVLHDIVDIEISERGAVNLATPFLDLSNIYDMDTGNGFHIFIHFHSMFLELRKTSSTYLPVLQANHIRALKIGGLDHHYQKGLV